jgi:DNA-binding GntR family transcriptional regulator
MLQNGTLRQKVYKYLRREMAHMNLDSDAFIDQNKICRHLKISRAPLRDALIQLEAEGFVKILPRRGVKINILSLEDIKHSYEMCAAIESYVLASVFHKFKTKHIERMEEINRKLHEMLAAGDSEAYYKLNLAFHDVFLSLSDNTIAKNFLYPLKQRLYDFPSMQYDEEWELDNLSEHQRLIQSIKVGNRDAAVAVICYEHWDFNLHKEEIMKVYGFNKETSPE